MKYDRLTISPSGSFTSAKNVSVQRLIDRLVVLENKIENGELISTVQSEQGEQEIAYFVKHNAAVRKQAVKDVLLTLLTRMDRLTGCGAPYHVRKFINDIAEENGIELVKKEDGE